MEKLNYPIGIQNFSEIIRNGYAYVDKTRYIPELLRNGKYKFLSRPRRFGKSLLISTLESFFLGKRELFCGLDIYRLMPESWEISPVIHIDFSGECYDSEKVLESKINFFLEKYEREYQLEVKEDSFSLRFNKIVSGIFEKTGKQVVVLIDEYDNPITSAIESKKLQARFREILYGFYSSLKSLDKYLRFVMLTGITKYGHLSVFSGLNNLMDISLDNNFAGICGITEDELHSNFRSGVEELAKEYGYSIEEAFAELKCYYDGYHFSNSLVDVYNPFSLMNALVSREISDYWFQSGIPNVLMKSLQTEAIDFSKISGSIATKDSLSDISAYKVNPAALFFQTGYLTIKGYDKTNRYYVLDYPNREIERGLMNSVLQVYGNATSPQTLEITLKNSLCEGDAKTFIEELKSFFAGVPFDLRRNIEKFENYYHSLFYVLIKLLGMNVSAEYHTSEGSIDILIKTAKYIYVIELKMHGDAEAAMSQIDEKGYAEPFSSDPRIVIKIGLGFHDASHTIDSYLIKYE